MSPVMPRPSWAVSAATWRAMENAKREETWERMTREERLVLLKALGVGAREALASSLGRS